MNTKVIVDTNFLYSLYGMSVNIELNNTRIAEVMKYKPYVTTPSIVEWIVKHRNNLNTIKLLTRDLLEDKLEIISVGFMPVDNDIIYKLQYSKNEHDANKYIDLIFKLKIKVESDFLRFVFLILISGYYEVFINESNADKNSVLLFTNSIYSPANIDFIKEHFVNSLEDSYANDDTEKVIKNCFCNLTAMFILVWRMNYIMTINNTNILGMNDIQQINIVKNAIKNDKIVDAMKNSLNDSSINLFECLNKINKNINYKQWLDKVNAEVFSSVTITEKAAKYLINKFERTFIRGGKPNKNDIIDMLVIIGLDLNDCLLFTVDGDLKEFLKQEHVESYDFIDKIMTS